MKKIYDTSKIDHALLNCKYAEILRGLEVPLFLIEYQTGENISNYNYFQIVLNGSLSIFFIRDDGSAYSLSIGGENYVIGEMDFFTIKENSVIAEASSPLLTVAIDTTTYKQQLLNNNAFLKLIASTLANKIVSITNNDAAPSSLPDRVLNYMTYKCENQTLIGIEKAAFRLHCSPRQLQRILNQFQENNIVTKTGKGRYVLNGLF